ncbi:hypothetical protein QBC35DRAFT_18484 [Podospora australis]|uniref:Ankyrin repeat protein n=1 Tax=Podospora australis TaxID=1536484 RepID=A0AAN6WPV6_9PEZI|nr:hypothetical protein QBC35DRAFT_18484 [Podospora australis]
MSSVPETPRLLTVVHPVAENQATSTQRIDAPTSAGPATTSADDANASANNLVLLHGPIKTDAFNVDIVAVRGVDQSFEGAWIFGPHEENEQNTDVKQDMLIKRDGTPRSSVTVSRNQESVTVGEAQSSRSDRAAAAIMGHLGMSRAGRLSTGNQEAHVRSDRSHCWLTHKDMLPANVGSWGRILSYSPKSSGTDVTEEEYDDLLDKMANNLLSRLQSARKEYESSESPLILIGTGSGCLLIQRLVAVILSSNPNDHLTRTLLRNTSSVVLFDAPIQPRDTSTDIQPKMIIPISSNQTKSSSSRFSTALAWENFFLSMKDVDRWCVSWFYQVMSSKGQTRGAHGFPAITFFPVSRTPRDKSKSPFQGIFSGPGDSNYKRLLSQIRGGLLLNDIRPDKRRKLLLDECRNKEDTLQFARAPCGATPLHRAASFVHDRAVQQVASKFPGMAVVQDSLGRTPLHLIIRQAIARKPKAGQRNSYALIISRLVDALAASRETAGGYQVDNDNKKAWDYVKAPDSERNEFSWILKLRTNLKTGATEADYEDLPTIRTQSNIQQRICQQIQADMFQFYITVSPDGNTERYSQQRPNIDKLIYDPEYGAHPMFEWITEHSMKPACRWIHLPANNERWIHDLLVHLRCSDRFVGRRYSGRKAYDRYVPASARRYHQVTPSSHCHVIVSKRGLIDREKSYKPPGAPSTKKRWATALFMPILGFEEHGYRKQLTSALMEQSRPKKRSTKKAILQKPPKEETSDEGSEYGEPAEREERLNQSALLLEAYINDRPLNLHCRRTLDQYTYPTLHDTEKRDNTQVMYKYVANHDRRKQKDDSDYPILMVDQLWLWILEDEENTVVSCVPDTWDPTSGFGFMDRMRKTLEGKDTRPLAASGTDLANIIIGCSLRFLRRAGPTKRVSVQEAFQATINNIAEDLSNKFNEFTGLVKQLDDDQTSPQDKVALSERLFKFSDETELTESIMDVQDELRTIRAVFRQQESALEKFVKIMSETKDVSSKEHKDAAENQNVLVANIKEVEGMASDAEQLRKELHELLDLKQKVANVWEARFSRIGSEETRRQGNITMLFTFVTIVFLPLSFLSSVFAIQMDIFPHDEESGEISWPADRALGYLFGVSFAVILPLCYIALRVERIANFYRTYFGPEPRDSIPGVYAPFFGLGTVHLHTRIPLLRRLWEWRTYVKSRLQASSPNNSPGKDGVEAQEFRDRVEKAKDYPLHRMASGLWHILFRWAKRWARRHEHTQKGPPASARTVDENRTTSSFRSAISSMVSKRPVARRGDLEKGDPKSSDNRGEEDESKSAQ